MRDSRMFLGLLVVLVAAVSSVDDCPAARKPTGPPDLTAGGERDPKQADFNLGPTGARGWVWGKQGGSYTSRQILVTAVAADSPAAGVLKVDDVILGVDGKPFSKDCRRVFGEAIGKAEATGKLPLLIWRDGKKTSVTLRLKVLGPYSKTWPRDCTKSASILRQGCEWIASTELKGISGDVNALALLASGEAKYLPKVKEYAREVAVLKKELKFEAQRGQGDRKSVV